MKRWLSQWIGGGGGGYSLPESSSPCLRPPTSLHQPSLSLFSLAQISQFISCEHILLILCARVAPACYQTVHGSHIRSNTHRPGRLSSACRYYSNLARAALQWLQCCCQHTKWLQCTIWNWSSSLALWFARSKLQAVFGGSTSQVKEPRPSIAHGYLPFMPAMCMHASGSNLDRKIGYAVSAYIYQGHIKWEKSRFRVSNIHLQVPQDLGP